MDARSVEIIRRALREMKKRHEGLLTLHLIGNDEKARLREEIARINKALYELDEMRGARR